MRYLRPVVLASGYLKLCLQVVRDGRKIEVQRLVHILLCQTFHGCKPSDAHHAAHGNGVRNDNRHDNIRWATPAENIADKTLHGTMVRGEDFWSAKLTRDAVQQIRQDRAGGESLESLARQHGVVKSTISKVAQRESWKWLDT